MDKDFEQSFSDNFGSSDDSLTSKADLANAPSEENSNEIKTKLVNKTMIIDSTAQDKNLAENRPEGLGNAQEFLVDSRQAAIEFVKENADLLKGLKLAPWYSDKKNQKKPLCAHPVEGKNWYAAPLNVSTFPKDAPGGTEGIALVLEGLIAIDEDSPDDNPNAASQKLREFQEENGLSDLPETFEVSSGREGRRARIYRIPPGKSLKYQTLKSALDQSVVEFRTGGTVHQCVQGKHPKTGRYQNNGFMSIEPLSDDWCEAIANYQGEKMGGWVQHELKTHFSDFSTDVGYELAKLETKLWTFNWLGYEEFHPRSEDQWSRVGRMLKQLTKRYPDDVEEIFQFWVEWSRTAEGYENEPESTYRAKWEQMKVLEDESKAEEIGTIHWTFKEEVEQNFERDCPEKAKEIQSTLDEIEKKKPKSSKNDRVSFDQESWEEDLENLRSEQSKKERLQKLAIDDESVHPESYYLQGIWKELYGGLLWDTMLNRHPAMTLGIITWLMGCVPLALDLVSPSGTRTPDSPTLYTFIHGKSGEGKKIIYNSLSKILGKVIKNLDKDKFLAQRQFIEELEERNKAESDENEGLPKIPFNPALKNISPAIMHEDNNPQGLHRWIAAQEAYRNAVNELGCFDFYPLGTATSQLIPLSEGQTLIDLWGLADAKPIYAAALNGYYDGEVRNLRRVRDSQFYECEKGYLSISLMGVTGQWRNLLRAEKPQGRKPGVVNGLSPRILSLGISKDPDKQEPEERSTEAQDQQRLKREEKAKELIKPALQRMQQTFDRRQNRVRWADDAIEVWHQGKAWLKEIGQKESAETWVAYVQKLPGNFVRLAFGFRLMRLVDHLTKTETPGYVYVEREDAEKALTLLKLCTYNRLLDEDVFREELGKEELAKSSARTLSQNDDRWFQIFSDPIGLKAWVEEQKQSGHTSPGDILRSKLSGNVRNRLKNRYQIHASELIKAIWKELYTTNQSKKTNTAAKSETIETLVAASREPESEAVETPIAVVENSEASIVTEAPGGLQPTSKHSQADCRDASTPSEPNKLFERLEKQTSHVRGSNSSTCL